MTTRDYTTADITVHWDSSLCTHCQACITGLPKVFSLERRPWVDLSQATTAEITKQVDECPSGALSWRKQMKPCALCGSPASLTRLPNPATGAIEFAPICDACAEDDAP